MFFSFFLFTIYFKIFLFLFLLCLISFLMFSVSRFISLLFVSDLEKISEYECGFEPFDSATRQPFDVHFYIVGLLFLIFDVEVSLLFPWSLNIFHSTWFIFWVVFCFIFILIFGLLFEWNLGILDWPYHLKP